ncbi:hypothetical protein PG996_000732 [Apiospora saccharicola]|uniref:Uncharacterized protein n=1 Tax=Apiospora saccharicola TaxID=335842 RepID=A0ABR1WHH8_9PEZI
MTTQTYLSATKKPRRLERRQKQQGRRPQIESKKLKNKLHESDRLHRRRLNKPEITSGLASAQEARARAQLIRDTHQTKAQATRDAALSNAQQARGEAYLTREAALANAQQARDRGHAARDAALANAQQARDAGQRTRDAALMNAHATRETALANAEASRERGITQGREAARAWRGGGGWSPFGGAFDARQNAREWVRAARETAMRHAWSTTSGAEAHADAARQHARHVAATAAGAERGVPVPAANDAHDQETGVVCDDASHPVEKKYEAIGSLESELEAKLSSLSRLEQTIQAEGVAAAQAGSGDSKMQTPTQQEYERLGTDIDEMSRMIEALRLEADEEFARELAESEAAATRP